MEESQAAIDLGRFFRVPFDKRDLNYDKYLTEGNLNKKPIAEFNSSNTKQMPVSEIMHKLLEMRYIQESLLDNNETIKLQ